MYQCETDGIYGMNGKLNELSTSFYYNVNEVDNEVNKDDYKLIKMVNYEFGTYSIQLRVLVAN